MSPPTNTATASGTPPVGDAVTDTDSVTLTAAQQPAITLDKTADVATYGTLGANTATASGTPPVGDAVTDTDSVTLTAAQQPAITLDKTADVATYGTLGAPSVP
ncbi:hypothetical protein E7811_17835 [Aliigemmobacter aestuarii]|uniref:Uncharacterized protein n=1 Tax=Aliigemmobacter aestuarii TaxID=1445661 RepID=A0A4S3MIF9_9RHOB|nr:hypothetical protein [Gemmobacter aestuarii]THD80818.1 hypothetical protein E7811_17835 [Gemmobacter aestuarii]